MCVNPAPGVLQSSGSNRQKTESRKPASCTLSVVVREWRTRLTVRAVSWVVLRPGAVVGHGPPAERVRRTLSTAGGALRRARVRRQGVVVELGRRRVGVQRQRLLQAHVAAVVAGEGGRLVSGQAAVLGAAGVILVAQAGRQAAGVARAAAGQARVEHVDLAGERGGLVVPGREAVGQP